MRRDRGPAPLPPTPIGFKIWFAFCGFVALSLIGLLVWAVITLVGHVAR